jgi:hypothetical protein
VKITTRLDKDEKNGNWIVRVVADFPQGGWATLATGSAPDVAVAASWALANFEKNADSARELLAGLGASTSSEMLKRMTPAPHAKPTTAQKSRGDS